ncbi:polysaccharide deacetylase family protein [Virgibacillus flavescens]|uniref:polysaccharide deacetylase family protein n=1 Tax=Virgibacillus flavescens TaxID=1611422 RepID=UPI003D3596E7
MYRWVIQAAVFFFLIVISFNQFFISNESSTITTFNNLQYAMKTKDPLYSEIKVKSSAYKIPPQNAVIDKVWKKIPGLNGRVVNVDQSYKKMKETGLFNEKLLVFDEVKPSVSIGDLPPAPIYRGNPEKKMAALMINVSWGTEHIPAILKILKQHHVKATFFLEGKWAKNNAKYAQMIEEEGHLIGNHAYNHPDMSRISEQEIKNQIQNTSNTIQAVTGKSPALFAPPSGSFTDQVVKVAADQNMQTILWSVDTIDWKNPSVSVMINRVKSKLHPGATILMHPTEAVVRGLSDMIKVIKENDYHIGTVEKLLSENRLD